MIMELARAALEPPQEMLARYPLGSAQRLQALSYALSQPKQIAIVGEPDGDDTQTSLAVAQEGYRPFQVVGLGAPGAKHSTVPLLRNRGLLDGQVTAYVCRNLACQAPVTERRRCGRGWSSDDLVLCQSKVTRSISICQLMVPS